jgi:two-component system chemotaxis response regulator CheY
LNKNRLRVLIVEDDPLTMATLKAMMEEMGAEDIYEASDGIAADIFIKEAALMIDFIICDWNMPNKTGFEFLKGLRKIYTDLPFLMVTARADENSVADARKAGVNGYICKPFRYEQLEHKVKSILKP